MKISQSILRQILGKIFNQKLVLCAVSMMWAGASFGVRTSKFFHITSDNKLAFKIQGTGWEARFVTVEDSLTFRRLFEFLYSRSAVADIAGFEPRDSADGVVYGTLETQGAGRPTGTMSIYRQNPLEGRKFIGLFAGLTTSNAEVGEFILTLHKDSIYEGCLSEVLKTYFLEVLPEIRFIGLGRMYLPNCEGKNVPLEESAKYFSCFNGAPLKVVEAEVDVSHLPLQEIFSGLNMQNAKSSNPELALTVEVSIKLDLAYALNVEKSMDITMKKLIGVIKSKGINDGEKFFFKDLSGEMKTPHMHENKLSYCYTYDVSQHDGQLDGGDSAPGAMEEEKREVEEEKKE